MNYVVDGLIVSPQRGLKAVQQALARQHRWSIAGVATSERDDARLSGCAVSACQQPSVSVANIEISKAMLTPPDVQRRMASARSRGAVLSMPLIAPPHRAWSMMMPCARSSGAVITMPMLAPRRARSPMVIAPSRRVQISQRTIAPMDVSRPTAHAHWRSKCGGTV